MHICRYLHVDVLYVDIVWKAICGIKVVVWLSIGISNPWFLVIPSGYLAVRHGIGGP
jgi:hypothetical protein